MIGPSDHLRVCAAPIVKCQTARAHVFSSSYDRRPAGRDQKTDFVLRRLVGDQCSRAAFVTLCVHRSASRQICCSLRARQLKVKWGFPRKPGGDYFGRVREALEWQDPVHITSVNLDSSFYIVCGSHSLDGIWNKDIPRTNTIVMAASGFQWRVR